MDYIGCIEEFVPRALNSQLRAVPNPFTGSGHQGKRRLEPEVGNGSSFCLRTISPYQLHSHAVQATGKSSN